MASSFNTPVELGLTIPFELALDESTQSQPLLDQIVNAKPSRCTGFDGLGMAVEWLSAVLRELS